ncbi:MAG: hypothetical protein HY654_03700, partial [Acidobacteria bacterium]|nr:hypothetical protein [Acidobacteriota bacterium]
TSRGIWIMFGGRRHVAVGRAVAFSAREIEQIGEYHGFPVYRERGDRRRTIYLPAARGMLAPYRPER